jgi:hypothetical protein
VKSELAGLTLTQEVSWKELKGVRKMVQRRTSLRCSGCDESAARSTIRSLAVKVIKAKNRKRPNYNVFYLLGSSWFEGNTPHSRDGEKFESCVIFYIQ